MKKSLWCRLGLHRWALSADAKTEYCLDCPYIGPVPEELREVAKRSKMNEQES